MLHATAVAFSVTLFNKYLAVWTRLPLLCVQMASSALFMLPIHKHFGEWHKWLVVPPLIFAMLASSMMALEHASVGSFVVARNLSPFCTLLLEAMLRGVRIEYTQIASLIAVFAGAVFYKAGDVHSSLCTALLGTNLLLASVDRVVEKHLLEMDAVAPLLVYVDRRWIQWDPYALVVLGLSCICGTALNYLGMLLQRQVSATAMITLGCLNKVLVVLYGVVAIHDASEPLSVLGILLSLGGFVVYSLSETPTQSAF